MGKIQILHIIKSLGRGGAEMLLPETLRLHDRDRFDFHYLYFLPWKDQMVGKLAEYGGRVTCFEASNNIQLMLQVRRVAAYIRENQISLVHAHLPWAGIVARLAGRMTGVPVIYTEHNKQERYHGATRWMNLATMNYLREVIAVSADVADSIRRHKPKLRPPVTTVLNGVNLQHFDPDAFTGREVREALSIPAQAPVVGTIAVFRFQKRLDLWIKLSAEILKACPDAHFIIVGDGPLKDELYRTREALGLQHRIHFAGLQTEVRPYLAAFDVYLMSSVFEGLPVALLEAMAMERPIVTTDAGGIKEVIRHDVDGLLCSVDAPEDLVGLTLRVLTQPAWRQSLGKQARVRVEESFSMRQMVNALEGIYNRIIGEWAQ